MSENQPAFRPLPKKRFVGAVTLHVFATDDGATVTPEIAPCIHIQNRGDFSLIAQALRGVADHLEQQGSPIVRLPGLPS